MADFQLDKPADRRWRSESHSIFMSSEVLKSETWIGFSLRIQHSATIVRRLGDWRIKSSFPLTHASCHVASRHVASHHVTLSFYPGFLYISLPTPPQSSGNAHTHNSYAWYNYTCRTVKPTTLYMHTSMPLVYSLHRPTCNAPILHYFVSDKF